MCRVSLDLLGWCVVVPLVWVPFPSWYFCKGLLALCLGVVTMEESDPARFSEGGTAQGAYLPYQSSHILTPSDSVSCAQHTVASKFPDRV